MRHAIRLRIREDAELFCVFYAFCKYILKKFAVCRGDFSSIIFCFMKIMDIFVTKLRHCGNGRVLFRGRVGVKNIIQNIWISLTTLSLTCRG